MTFKHLKVSALALSCVLGVSPAFALLDEAGFRAVPVAQSDYPISALAVAPDGRLFAAVQALGDGGEGAESQTAEIRVYSDYDTSDGAILDEGSVWATLTEVRATNIDEGLLGIALAPDFASSKLVYVYLTTTDDENNQHIRVYRENTFGVGEYLGTVATALEPPVGSSYRNGGGMTFGSDGCLYVGIGDNASGNRWNAQVLEGTDSIQYSERQDFCSDVCAGTDEYPDRSDDNGLPNHAGKVLRLDVEGPSTVQPGLGSPLAAQPYAFGTGLGNPVSLGVHPLTGQIYAAERGEYDEAELDVVDGGGNYGWPCLEGASAATTSASSCISGDTDSDVYGRHPGWRRPIVTHDVTTTISGVKAYTGRGYPAEYYGDMFYLLRDRTAIYRINLEAPCFLPHPSGVTPLAFHDSNDDDDFYAYYDSDDGDDEYDYLSFRYLIDLVQAPGPMGTDVLYVTGRQHNSSALDADSIIFRIEYATSFTPYAGPDARVPDTCFSEGAYTGTGPSVPYLYENPFNRPTCLPPGGSCPGAADGTDCSDGDECNGADTCQSGICRHGTPAPDGTACVGTASCRGDGICEAGACVAGAVVADGTPCPDNNPCNGLETCVAGLCQSADGPAPLSVNKLIVKQGKKPGTDAIVLTGVVRPQMTIAPNTSDEVGLELHKDSGVLYEGTIDHPSSDSKWRRSGRKYAYKDGSGAADGLTTVNLQLQKGGNLTVKIKGKRMSITDLTDPSVSPHVIIGDECFSADLSSECKVSKRKLRCKR